VCYNNDVYRRSLADPEGFWGGAAEAIDWSRKWDKVLDQSKSPFTRWFAGAELNTCFNALDRHVGGGRAEHTALTMTARSPRRSRNSHIANCSKGPRASPADFRRAASVAATAW
jgi:hypothetical protein